MRALEHSFKETFIQNMEHSHPLVFIPMHRLYILKILQCAANSERWPRKLANKNNIEKLKFGSAGHTD